MSFSDAYIHSLKFSHYPGKHIWISAEAQFENLVVVKFKVTWLCDLTIRSPKKRKPFPEPPAAVESVMLPLDPAADTANRDGDG